MDTCVRMAESLCCPPEIITTLLTSDTLLQSKKVFKNAKKSVKAVKIANTALGKLTKILKIWLICYLANLFGLVFLKARQSLHFR